MIASLLVAIPLAAAFLALVPRTERLARWVVAGAGGLCAILAAYAAFVPQEPTRIALVPTLALTYAVSADPLAVVLVGVAALVVAVAAAASTRVPDVRLYAALLALVLACIDGALVARDLLLFLFWWELVLVPIALLAERWGTGRGGGTTRDLAPFVVLDSLLFTAIASLAAIRGTTDIDTLAALPLAPAAQTLPLALMLPALVARLGLFPLQVWTDALGARIRGALGIVLLPAFSFAAVAAIIRIAGGLFPSALAAAAPVLVALASVGCLSAALVAVAREDGQGIVRTIATSRLELVALGLFTATAASIAGAVLLVIAVALSAAAAELAVAAVGSRVSLRSIGPPVRSGLAGVLTAAVALLMALPGSADFAGTLTVLVVAYERYPIAAVLATLSLLVTAVAGLTLLRHVVHGPHIGEPTRLPVLRYAAAAPLVALALVLGIAPALVTERLALDLIGVALR